MNSNKFFISLIIAVIAAGGLGFYGGMVYGKKQAPTATAAGRFANGAAGARGQGFGNATGGPAGRLAGAGGNASVGEIAAKDDTSVTLKLMDGGSKVVLFSSSTHVGKMSDGTTSDLTTGTNVMVTGTTNQDGSITASNIQIRPASSTDMFMMRGGAGGQVGQPPAGAPVR